jgi:hypothetical protein
MMIDPAQGSRRATIAVPNDAFAMLFYWSNPTAGPLPTTRNMAAIPT